MSELFWPDLAKDLVLISLPGTGTRTTLGMVLKEYRLDLGDLAPILESPRFKALLEAAAARAKSLGHRAGFVLRAEAILAALAEQIYLKAVTPTATLSDVVRAFAAVQQSLSGGSGAGAAGATTNILIQVPRLDNPKLRHLERGLPIQDDGDGQGPA